MQANKDKECLGSLLVAHPAMRARNSEQPKLSRGYSPSLGFSFPPASSSKENEKKGMTTVSKDGLCCFQ